MIERLNRCIQYIPSRFTVTRICLFAKDFLLSTIPFVAITGFIKQVLADYNGDSPEDYSLPTSAQIVVPLGLALAIGYRQYLVSQTKTDTILPMYLPDPTLVGAQAQVGAQASYLTQVSKRPLYRAAILFNNLALPTFFAISVYYILEPAIDQNGALAVSISLLPAPLLYAFNDANINFGGIDWRPLSNMSRSRRRITQFGSGLLGLRNSIYYSTYGAWLLKQLHWVRKEEDLGSLQVLVPVLLSSIPFFVVHYPLQVNRLAKFPEVVDETWQKIWLKGGELTEAGLRGCYTYQFGRQTFQASAKASCALSVVSTTLDVAVLIASSSCWYQQLRTELEENLLPEENPPGPFHPPEKGAAAHLGDPISPTRSQTQIYQRKKIFIRSGAEPLISRPPSDEEASTASLLSSAGLSSAGGSRPPQALPTDGESVSSSSSSSVRPLLLSPLIPRKTQSAHPSSSSSFFGPNLKQPSNKRKEREEVQEKPLLKRRRPVNRVSFSFSG